jgi:hypothetical protein
MPGSDETTDDDAQAISGTLYFVLLVSFYWTFQVIAGVVSVTIAGVVGTW